MKVDDENLEEHIASSHPRCNFAVQSNRNTGDQVKMLLKKQEVDAEFKEEVLELLEKLYFQDRSSCMKEIIDVHSAPLYHPSSPTCPVPPELYKAETKWKQDWCPPTPVPVRDLDHDPIPVVMAVSLDMAMDVKKKTIELSEDDIFSCTEVKASGYADN